MGSRGSSKRRQVQSDRKDKARSFNASGLVEDSDLDCLEGMLEQGPTSLKSNGRIGSR